VRDIGAKEEEDKRVNQKTVKHGRFSSAIFLIFSFVQADSFLCIRAFFSAFLNQCILSSSFVFTNTTTQMNGSSFLDKEVII